MSCFVLLTVQFDDEPRDILDVLDDVEVIGINYIPQKNVGSAPPKKHPIKLVAKIGLSALALLSQRIRSKFKSDYLLAKIPRIPKK